MSGYYKVVS